MQANLIGAEFHDPQSSGGQPLHEELYTKLITAGIYSVHGRDHMISTVCLHSGYITSICGASLGSPSLSSSCLGISWCLHACLES